jgi:hypothetical protein
MNWKGIGLMSVGIMGVVAVVGATWTTADYLKVRPVIVMEMEKHIAEFKVVAQSVAWIKLTNFENILKRGGILSRKDCAIYTNLAKSLGVPPLPC